MTRVTQQPRSIVVVHPDTQDNGDGAQIGVPIVPVQASATSAAARLRGGIAAAAGALRLPADPAARRARLSRALFGAGMTSMTGAVALGMTPVLREATGNASGGLIATLGTRDDGQAFVSESQHETDLEIAGAVTLGVVGLALGLASGYVWNRPLPPPSQLDASSMVPIHTAEIPLGVMGNTAAAATPAALAPVEASAGSTTGSTVHDIENPPPRPASPASPT